jgi:hypothetical protein
MALPITSSLKTITLGPGECAVLPAGAVITAVILDGAASATSSCGALPTPSAYVCGAFYLNVDDDASDNHPNDEESTNVSSVTVGGMTYVINENANTASVAQLNLHITDLALFEFTSITRYSIDDAGDNKRRAVYIFFRVPEPLFSSLQMKITANEGMLEPATYYLVPTEAECE